MLSTKFGFFHKFIHRDINVSCQISGPGYHRGEVYTENLEEHGFINQQLDQQLLQTFMANIGQGSVVQKLVGPWALGVDILPSTVHEKHIDFFVIRSICSEVNASV